MKKHLLIAIYVFLGLNSLFAQLKLQQINNKKTITIPLNAEVTFKLPTFTSIDSCECYRMFKGKLIETKKDTAAILMSESQHLYVDSKGVGVFNGTQLKYNKNKFTTPIILENPLSISRELESRKGLEGLGGITMLLAVTHALIISPFLEEKVRKKTDKIAFIGFALGLSVVLLPNEKTYYMQQPKKKSPKKLWRLLAQ